MNRIPNERIPGQIRPIPMTVLQDAAPGRSRAPMEMQSSGLNCKNHYRKKEGDSNSHATRIPKVINNWYVAVRVPRSCAGAVSAWYYSPQTIGEKRSVKLADDAP